MSSGDESFYADLPAVEKFTEVPSPAAYTKVPDSWALIITDVRGSTKAIEAGRYKHVNALGVASIVAVKNAVPGLDIPFVFGGDGATLLCPKSKLDQVIPALRGLKRRSSEGFGLQMRAGVVPIDELHAAGHPIYAARFRASEHVSLAMLAGEGLTVGEAWVKDPQASYEVDDSGEATVDFEGFECRWQPLEAQKDHVISLLVQAQSPDRETAATVYSDVLSAIDNILGEGAGRPATLQNLMLASAPTAFDAEARLKSGNTTGLGFRVARLKTAVMTGIGRLLLKTGKEAGGFNGAVYRNEVAANTDFRKFDETLRMVIDVSDEQLAALREVLEKVHERGDIVYGIHSANAALMTCVIGDYSGDHVHFVDGADGGYALAAKQLKAQLKAPRRGE